MIYPNFTIKANGPISQAFLKLGLKDFQQACMYVKDLRYQRTSIKSIPLLVLEEKRGTCSSKHALLKKLAEENYFNGIDLMIGIYKMTTENTPGIKHTIPKSIKFIPEAHAYLIFDRHRIDCTRTNVKNLKDEDILEEMSLEADEMGSKKEQIHIKFLKDWCKENNLNFNEIWKIRESCISKLSS